MIQAFPDAIAGSPPSPPDPIYSPTWGWSRQPLASQDLGCYLLAHLAVVPDSRFSKGQAQLLSQGHIGLATEGPSGWFARIWGDFEPSAVAGVVSLTSSVHGLPGGWPASCWGAGFVGLAACRGQQSQKREDGAERQIPVPCLAWFRLPNGHCGSWSARPRPPQGPGTRPAGGDFNHDMEIC